MNKIIFGLCLLVFSACSCYKDTPQTAVAATANIDTTPLLSVPNIERIKIATVVSQDIKTTTTLYIEWLNYKIVEKGHIPKALAHNWGTPKMANKSHPYTTPLRCGEAAELNFPF